MSLGPKNQLWMRHHGQLSETVFIVHQVVKRETGKWTWSRQFLKERAMRSAGGIVIPASAKISAAKPWLQPRIAPLVTRFGSERICTMSYCSPRSSLDRSPEQHVGFAIPQIKNVGVVATDRRDVDRRAVLGAHRDWPRIGLEHITAIPIIGRENPALTFTNRSMDL